MTRKKARRKPKRRKQKGPHLCDCCGKWAATVRLFLRDLELRAAQRLLHLPPEQTPHVYDYPEIRVCKFCALEALGEPDERILELERAFRDFAERFENLRHRVAVLEEDDAARSKDDARPRFAQKARDWSRA